MRVISGKYKRTILNGYDIEGIRPTMDKVKESLFAMINDSIKDSICLDLFSGTGSIGIEALSNYSKRVYFVDKMKIAIDTTKSNLGKLDSTDYEVINDNYTSALKKFSNNGIKFDIIFIDPPYGKIKIKEVIDEILKYDILMPNALLVCEYEKEILEENYGNLELIKDRKYGKTFIKIYKLR